jgi:hypothetical protein
LRPEATLMSPPELRMAAAQWRSVSNTTPFLRAMPPMRGG